MPPNGKASFTPAFMPPIHDLYGQDTRAIQGVTNGREVPVGGMKEVGRKERGRARTVGLLGTRGG
jgi:hypothetical protein